MVLLNYLLETSILLSLLFLVYCAFLKSSTFHLLNRWFLLASIFLCVIVPFIQLPSEIMQQNFTYRLPLIEVHQNVNISDSTEARNFNYLHFLMLMYVIVAIIFMANLLKKYAQLHQKIINIPFEKLHNFNIYFGKSNIPAFSFFTYIFIPTVENEQEKEVLLQHEIAHAKAFHSLDVLLVEFFKCILWFHPVIYLLKNELVAQHEFAIDQELTNKSFSVQQYGQLLINQTQLQPAFLGLTNFFNKSLIKNRIKMMTAKRSKKQVILNYCVAAFIALFTCMFMVACEQEEDQRENINNKATEKQEEAINKKNLNSSKVGEIYQIVEKMPSFPGGDKEMLNFLYTNIKYPAAAKANDIQGMVVLSFIVNNDGSISDIEVLRDIGGGCGDEAARVTGLMPKWQPGMQNDQNVRVEYKLPVRFKLTDDTPAE